MVTTYNSSYVNQDGSKPEVEIQGGDRRYSRGLSKAWLIERFKMFHDGSEFRAVQFSEFSATITRYTAKINVHTLLRT